MTKNDTVIMKLKEQIKKKKSEIARGERFSPITNCSLELDGVRYNLHVLTKEQIVQVLVRLNIYLKSAIELELKDDYYLSGYHIGSWISDLQSKLTNLTIKAEQDKLRKMEERLHNLLSNDKKIELEIDDIRKALE